MPKPVNGFRDEVEVFAGVQRQGDAGSCCQVTAPHAAAVDDDIGGDMALFLARVPIHARHPAHHRRSRA